MSGIKTWNDVFEAWKVLKLPNYVNYLGNDSGRFIYRTSLCNGPNAECNETYIIDESLNDVTYNPTWALQHANMDYVSWYFDNNTDTVLIFPTPKGSSGGYKYIIGEFVTMKEFINIADKSSQAYFWGIIVGFAYEAWKRNDGIRILTDDSPERTGYFCIAIKIHQK